MFGACDTGRFNLSLSFSLQLHIPESMGPQNETLASTVLWCPEGPELSVIHKDWKINLFTIRYIKKSDMRSKY